MLKTVCCVKKPSAFVRLMGFFMLRSTCQHLTIRQVLLLYPHCRIYEGGLYLKKRTGHRLLFSRKSYPGGQLIYTLFFAVSLAPMLCLSASAAEDVTIWTKASEIMQDVYSQILKISTVAAVVTAAIALLMTNFSRSGRTVEESRAWLKRIVITWVILNGLGFILAYITPFFEGGQYTFTS